MSDISTPRRQEPSSETSNGHRAGGSSAGGSSAGGSSAGGSSAGGSSAGGSGKERTTGTNLGAAQTETPTGSTKRSGRVRSASGTFRFIDNYGLLVCLGEGGMGEVWAARDPDGPKNLVVAVKTTKQQGAEAARVLWDEARIASLIEHPNVCRVREMGRDGDLQYLVMDYCDGGTLHDLVERSEGRVLSHALSARILSGVCAGLHAAHELTDEAGRHLGVVHRDVSPQNILLSTTGQVSVTDFGVAKALGQAHKATETGEMKGKLSYMAPEQITSRDIDRRVDVFALGCVLYQVTLGKRPFHGEDALATLYQLLEKDLVPPHELDPDYPPELEQVLLKALAKNREDRYSTAEEMQRALEHFLLSYGKPLSEADVAQAVMEALGESIGARKEEIRRRIRALETGEPLATGSGRTSVVPASADGVDTTAGTVTDPPPVGVGRTSWLAAAGVFFAIGLGTIALLRGTGSDEGAGEAAELSERADSAAVGQLSATSSSGPASSLAPGDAGPKTGAEARELGRETQATESGSSGEEKAMAPVALSIKVTPDSALIEIDGKQVGTGSYQEEVPRSTQGHILQLSAPGHESLTRALVFDRSQALELSLVPQAKVQQRAPTTQPKATTKPTTPTTSTKTKKKAPRSLDSENPFASSE